MPDAGDLLPHEARLLREALAGMFVGADEDAVMRGLWACARVGARIIAFPPAMPTMTEIAHSQVVPPRGRFH